MRELALSYPRSVVNLETEPLSAIAQEFEARLADCSALAFRVALFAQPIIRQFKLYSDLLMRDGQTLQSSTATDLISGRVLKVETTMNVVK